MKKIEHEKKTKTSDELKRKQWKHIIALLKMCQKKLATYRYAALIVVTYINSSASG